MKTLVYFVLVFMVAVPAVAQVDDNARPNLGTMPNVRQCPPIPSLSPEACPGGRVVRGGVGPNGCPLPPKCGESETGGLFQKIKDIGGKLMQEGKEIKTEVRNVRDAVKDEIREQKNNVMSEEKDIRGDFEQFREDQLKKMEESRNRFREMIKAERNEFKNAMEQKREELKVKIEKEKEQLREGLLKIKNEKKREIVEHVSQKIADLNKKITAHLSDVLVKLENVLVNINSRADKTEAKGLDVGSVRLAIGAAKNRIENARTAIQLQASKIYSITVNSEEMLKPDVGVSRQALQNDLKQLQNVVKEARDAVHSAATTLAGVVKEDASRPADIPSN